MKVDGREGDNFDELIRFVWNSNMECKCIFVGWESSFIMLFSLFSSIVGSCNLRLVTLPFLMMVPVHHVRLEMFARR